EEDLDLVHRRLFSVLIVQPDGQSELWPPDSIQCGTADARRRYPAPSTRTSRSSLHEPLELSAGCCPAGPEPLGCPGVSRRPAVKIRLSIDRFEGEQKQIAVLVTDDGQQFNIPSV